MIESDNDAVREEQLKCKKSRSSAGEGIASHLRDTLRQFSVFIIAAVLLCLPAVFNGYPLLYPDTIEYLSVGPRILSKLIGNSEAGFYGMRSPFYSIFTESCLIVTGTSHCGQ
jgi:hypothetical protein